MPDARYGYKRYGRHEYESPEIDLRGADHPRDVLTPREAFGAGIALKPAPADAEDIGITDADQDENYVAWDFAVDGAGDLAATEGFDELAKDIAFGTARDAKDLLGMLGTPNDLAELEIAIERVANRDSRLFTARASALNEARGPPYRGVGDALDPTPGMVSVDLDLEVTPEISRNLGFGLSRR